MPLHKSSRGHRLDPTMISAPLGDFRHTMHIGRGGDVFGDTSFLSTHGPSPSSTNSTADTSSSMDAEPVVRSSPAHGEPEEQPWELQHSESSLSLDLDLDLGPSILGDVLGVMDGLGFGSGSTWTAEDTSQPKNSTVEVKEIDRSGKEFLPSVHKEVHVKDGDSLRRQTDGQVSEESSLKLKGAGLRPKVRFSDKKEEIIGRGVQAEELEQDRGDLLVTSQGNGNANCNSGSQRRSQDSNREPTNHTANSLPSPSSSVSSEYEGVSPLDRRREENHVHESDSEEEEEEDTPGCRESYTFEDEFDDEIGL